MTKKKLNIDTIANELEGASLFFAKPASPLSALQPDEQKAETSTNSLSDSPFFEKPANPLSQVQDENNQDQKRTNERTFERPNDRSNERSIKRLPKQKREKIRHTFDIYRDQLVALQTIQLEKFQAGKKKPKLGTMVAEGIDLYIKQQASKKKRA